MGVVPGDCAGALPNVVILDIPTYTGPPLFEQPNDKDAASLSIAPPIMSPPSSALSSPPSDLSANFCSAKRCTLLSAKRSLRQFFLRQAVQPRLRKAVRLSKQDKEVKYFEPQYLKTHSTNSFSTSLPLPSPLAFLSPSPL